MLSRSRLLEILEPPREHTPALALPIMARFRFVLVAELEVALIRGDGNEVPTRVENRDATTVLVHGHGAELPAEPLTGLLGGLADRLVGLTPQVCERRQFPSLRSGVHLDGSSSRQGIRSRPLGFFKRAGSDQEVYPLPPSRAPVL
jgi:hypothetical protein